MLVNTLLMRLIIYFIFNKKINIAWLNKLGFKYIFRYHPENTLSHCVIKVKYLLLLSKSVQKYNRKLARLTQVTFEYENAYVFIGEVNRLNRELKKQISSKSTYPLLITLKVPYTFTGLVEDWLVDNADILVGYKTYQDNLLTQLDSLNNKLSSTTLNIQEVNHVTTAITNTLTNYKIIINLFSYNIK